MRHLRSSLKSGLLAFSGVALLLLLPPGLGAQTCISQAEMDAATRNGIENVALGTARAIAATGVSAVTSAIAPQVANQASGILSSVAAAAPLVRGASFVAQNLYLLDATDLPVNVSSTQFFCAASDPALHVVFNLGQLPSALYAIAMLHATGVARPQQLTLIFAQPAAGAQGPSPNLWKLAGFAYKPLTIAGHDGVWYWRQARMFAQQKQNWNAYFYYETARALVVPVDFVSSSNLNKLLREENAVKPAGLPGSQPMQLTSGAQSFAITNLHTDEYLGALNLVVHYKTGSVADPTATRQQIVQLMQGLLAAHPELRQAFQGMWVYAEAPGQDPFGIEMPMRQIP